MSDSSKQLIITDPKGGEILGIAGSKYRIVLTGKQSQGKMAVIEMNIPPGSGPIPHEHPSFQESFYVLEGEVEMRTKEQTFLAKKGAMVTIPQNGPIHSFKNISGTFARLLCIVAPAGLDSFFREVGKPSNGNELLTLPKEEGKQKMKDAAIKYGQKLYSPDYFEK